MSPTSKPALDAESVRKVAELARLSLSSAEAQRFSEQLGQILGYIAKLNELDTAKVEPLTHALELGTALRDDIVVPGPGAEAITSVAPDAQYDNFKVPQIIGGGQ